MLRNTSIMSLKIHTWSRKMKRSKAPLDLQQWIFYSAFFKITDARNSRNIYKQVANLYSFSVIEKTEGGINNYEVSHHFSSKHYLLCRSHSR